MGKTRARASAEAHPVPGGRQARRRTKTKVGGTRSCRSCSPGASNWAGSPRLQFPGTCTPASTGSALAVENVGWVYSKPLALILSKGGLQRTA
jgi:hypothetical protein